MKVKPLLVIALTGLSLVAGGALAQSANGYPNKHIRFVVPFAAGISPDVIARVLGERLSRSLGQPVIVDNKPGAAGIIGAENVANSPADGYTLFMAVNSIVAINPHIYPKLPYDAQKDFAPVTQVALVPYVLIATPSLPVKSTGELIALAKSKPGQIAYASLGVGSGPHVVMEMLCTMAGIELNHVPYKGNSLNDVIAGQVGLSFEPATTAVPQIKAGKVRALAVTSTKRLAALPGVPTIAETVPGYNGDGWQGILVHVKTPKSIVDKLNVELVRIIKEPEVQQRFAELGLQGVGNSVNEFERVFRTDYERWGQVVRAANVKAEF
jgi:tripartite-type tricarboxylate transporter receptor subunit TctC